MLIISASVRRFSTFFTEDAELFCEEVERISDGATIFSGRGKSWIVPLFKTACHSSGLFSTGNDMVLALEVPNREPINGIVGIDFKITPLEGGGTAR